YEAAHVAEKGGDARPGGHAFRHRSNADIDRHMLVQKGRIDAQIDVVWNTVRSVIGHHEDTPEPWLAHYAESFVRIVSHHLKLPCICHHPGRRKPRFSAVSRMTS